MVEENRNKYHCIFPLWSIWSCPSKRAHISGVADRFDSSTNSQWCACYAFKQKPLSTFKDVVKSFAHHNSIWTYLVSLRLVNREKLWTNMHFNFITSMNTHLYRNLFTLGHEIYTLNIKFHVQLIYPWFVKFMQRSRENKINNAWNLQIW